MLNEQIETNEDIEQCQKFFGNECVDCKYFAECLPC